MAILSGQKAVAAAGAAERLHSDCAVNGSLLVRALPNNTGVMYIGQAEGDVDSANGMPLAAGDSAVFAFVGNLNQIWVDAAVNGEKVAWLILEA
ncbi:MAG: hypothetical protein L0Z70_16435 [Chloroflexi bacterium]|nr:hypothetical protein [Chloroflexota bacterium]